MDLIGIGQRIRKQREFIGYTREQFAELLDVTPKFCSDIELGVKGMSLSTLCKISELLKLSTDYLLFGRENRLDAPPIFHMLQTCPPEKQVYAETILKNFLVALDVENR